MAGIIYQSQTEAMENKKSKIGDMDLDPKSDVLNMPKIIGTDYSYQHTWVWKNVIAFLILHVLGLVGFFLVITGQSGFKTFLWTIFVAFMAAEGVTIGAHRLYTHKAFKAKPALRFILILMQTMAGQNSLFIWARDHRLHHRYSDTDGDPHNSKRGFFFCHIGWLMKKKHPHVIELGRKIDMSDLQADWMIMYQKKYYYPLYLAVAILLPMLVPMYYFNEVWWKSLLVVYFFRYTFTLNGAWLVNSAAHLYGTRPYDKNLQPVESWFVSLISFGEGWHNYHHTFPWDYKAAELSTHLNASAYIIEFCQKIGLASDLKTASPEMVKKRIIRTGDGTHYLLGDDVSKKAVTALGLLHPLNPSYTTTQKAPDATLKLEGLPLFHEKDLFNVDSVLKRKVATA